MRKLLTILLLLLVTLSVGAQTYRIKTSEFAVKFKDINNNWEPWSDWEETSLLILIDLDDEVILIDNKIQDEFYVRSYEGETTREDKDGDSITDLTLNVYDKDNVKCNITISMWDDYNIVQVYISYNNIKYVYSGKILNP